MFCFLFFGVFVHVIYKDSLMRGGLCSPRCYTLLHSQLSHSSSHWSDSQIFVENRNFCLHHLHSTPSLRGTRRNISAMFSTENLEGFGYTTVKKNWRYVYSFRQNTRTCRTDGQTGRHRATAQAALMQKRHCTKTKPSNHREAPPVQSEYRSRNPKHVLDLWVIQWTHLQQPGVKSHSTLP